MTAFVLHQRMCPWPPDPITEPPQPNAAIVGLYIAAGSVLEGQSFAINVQRSNNLTSYCTVRWRATPANPADISSASSTTETFSSGQTSKTGNVTTVNRSGIQGTRSVLIALEDPQSCEIDPVHASVAVTIEDVVIDPGPDPGPGPPATRSPRPLPTALRKIYVANSTQLSAAMNGNYAGLTTEPAGATGPCRPGDHIICRDGTYVGNLTLNGVSGGDHSKPLVLKAENTLQAKISGDVTFAGPGAYFIGFDIINNKKVFSAPGVNARDCRLSRCRITQSSARAIKIENAAQRFIIDCNDIKGAAVQGVELNPSTDCNHIVELNWIHDQATSTAGEALRIGTGRGESNIRSGSIVRWNLFENWVGDDDEVISNKSSNNTYEFNTFRNCQSPFTIRHGENNEVRGNIVKGGGFRVFDRGNRLISNIAYKLSSTENIAGGINMASGDLTPDQWDASPTPGKTHPASYNGLFVDNTTDSSQGLLVGGGGYPLDAVSNTIIDHHGNKTMMNHTNTMQPATYDGPLYASDRYELTAADVGPFLPEATTPVGNPYDLKVATNYTKYSHADATLITTATGVRMGADPVDWVNKEAAIWFKERITAKTDFSVTFDLIRRNSDSWGRDMVFFLPCTGNGSTNYAADMSAWTDYDPTEAIITQHSRGNRISMGNNWWESSEEEPPGADEATHLNYWPMNGPGVSAVSGSIPYQENLFGLGVRTNVLVTRVGNSVKVRFQVGTLSRTKEWIHTSNNDITTGNFGFRVFKGLWDIENFARLS